MYIHSFRLNVPRNLLEATTLGSRYAGYDEIQNIPDRLRWCRHRKGLLQADVARLLGMSHSAYKSIECGSVRRISRETAQKLSGLFGVPAADFLDGYSAFLYCGQAAGIRACREKLGLTRCEFAAKLRIPTQRLERWEEERTALSYRSWERYFKGRA